MIIGFQKKGWALSKCCLDVWDFFKLCNIPYPCWNKINKSVHFHADILWADVYFTLDTR